MAQRWGSHFTSVPKWRVCVYPLKTRHSINGPVVGTFFVKGHTDILKILAVWDWQGSQRERRLFIFKNDFEKNLNSQFIWQHLPKYLDSIKRNLIRSSGIMKWNGAHYIVMFYVSELQNHKMFGGKLGCRACVIWSLLWMPIAAASATDSRGVGEHSS